jgi:hypothetical protein
VTRWLLVLAALSVVSGCGASLVYPRLDTLVGLYISGLVSLDDSQSAQLARTLERNLEWHRSEELARYDAFLRSMAAQVASGLTRASLEQAAARAEAYWRRIFEQAAPGYTSLAATLTDAQVAELLQGFERADEKTWREWSHSSSEERYKHREKSLRKNIERLTGPLDARQRAMLHDYALAARPFMFEWRENRRLWREELAATLRLRQGGSAEYVARMRVLIAEPDRLWTSEYRKALQTSRDGFLDLLVRLDATLSAQQRRQAQERLLELAGDVRGLAQRGG